MSRHAASASTQKMIADLSFDDAVRKLQLSMDNNKWNDCDKLLLDHPALLTARHEKFAPTLDTSRPSTMLEMAAISSEGFFYAFKHGAAWDVPYTYVPGHVGVSSRVAKILASRADLPSLRMLVAKHGTDCLQMHHGEHMSVMHEVMSITQDANLSSAGPGYDRIGTLNFLFEHVPHLIDVPDNFRILPMNTLAGLRDGKEAADIRAFVASWRARDAAINALQDFSSSASVKGAAESGGP